MVITREKECGIRSPKKNGNADAQLLTINCSLDIVEQHVDDGGDVADVEAAVEVQVG